MPQNIRQLKDYDETSSLSTEKNAGAVLDRCQAFKSVSSPIYSLIITVFVSIFNYNGGKNG